MNAPEIEFSCVTKVFRQGLFRPVTAVDDISFAIGAGEVVGILGANGSGKSTSLKMLLGFLFPTRGDIRICGYLPHDGRARRLIGYLPETPRFQRFLTAEQVLRYYGRLSDWHPKQLEPRMDELLDLVGLAAVREQKVGGFSKGMTQRLAIAQALLHKPRVLVFDEPMSGLDPVGRREIRHLIAEIRRQLSVTILFSSHILSDVEQLCQSVLLLKKGRMTRHCSVTELLSSEPDCYRLVVSRVPADVAKGFPMESLSEGGHFSFTLSGTDTLHEVLGRLKTEGVAIVSLTSQRRSLEDSLFLATEDQGSEAALL